jgi:hypothetical protein
MNIQNIKVKTVDTEKLIDFLGIKLKDNERLSIDSFAIYEDKFQIDSDCCFSEILKYHIKDQVYPMIQIECRIKKYDKKGSYTIRMDKPDFIKGISIEKYLSIATEVNLVDFIRFDYNPRIMGNQKLLMKYIKASKVENL